ncbi:hypothetical protein EJB05_30332, partial [Eragrostis curvula]
MTIAIKGGSEVGYTRFRYANKKCLKFLRSKMSSQAEGKACDVAPKTEWPELVGRSIKEAKEKIKADRPDLKIQVVTVGTSVTEEFDTKRVRIWVDTVAEVPKIG